MPHLPYARHGERHDDMVRDATAWVVLSHLSFKPFCALYLDVKLLVHIAFGKLIADTWLGNSSKIKDAGGTPVASAKQHPPNWPHEHLPHQGTPETTPHQLTTVVDINLP
ncbi:hypothetical protein BHE74_00036443 [Ensete ventricosum]|nr:hypothetical protein BHE74_00036443 [Ensete ventricosum]